jgi:hypothetical protein
MPRKPTDEVQLKLRFKEKLRQRLSRAAAQSGRSMNAEIIHRLEVSFTEADLRSSLKIDLERIRADMLQGFKLGFEETQRALEELQRKELRHAEATKRYPPVSTYVATIAKKDES